MLQKTKIFMLENLKDDDDNMIIEERKTFIKLMKIIVSS